jgi:phosphomannomutase/phosphoglucomutase
VDDARPPRAAPRQGVRLNAAIFREYDIRGIAERDFDAGFARDLGRAFATLAAETGRRTVSVGRDCRLTSERYAAALRAGLTAGGLDVVDLGVCPTPLMYFSLFHWDLDGGVQVTGSHNPADYNGFKLCLGTVALYGDEIQDLRRRLEAGRFAAGAGRVEARAVGPAYQAHVAGNVGRLAREIRVVVDAGNGTAGPVAPGVYRRLGASVHELYCEMDGRFPHHHPDPTVAENMQDLVQTVRATGAELGIAFDGDADRIGVVDRHGRIIWGDELLVLYGRDVLSRNPGATIVSEVKCSQRLYDDIVHHGGRPVMWKAGHSLLKAKMRETGALLGGEMSGHMYFKDRYFGYDDGIYAACRALEIAAAEDLPLSARLADLPRYVSTPEIRVASTDEDKFRIVEAVAAHFRGRYETLEVDGARVLFPGGWGLVRASNTQPVLVVRFEADSAANLERIQGLVREKLQELTGAEPGF